MDFQTLNLLFRCHKAFSHEKIRMQEMSDTECMLCSYIYSHDAYSQDDVSVALKTDKTTVGKALMSLERKGCVLREQDAADRRLSASRSRSWGARRWRSLPTCMITGSGRS